MRSWMMAAILCPMCKSSITNAENAAELSQTVDAAVLALLLPTIAIIIGLIRLVLKYRHPDDEF
jgi:predicted histidine transporter YuiF (NhaC family)